MAKKEQNAKALCAKIVVIISVISGIITIVITISEKWTWLVNIFIELYNILFMISPVVILLIAIVLSVLLILTIHNNHSNDNTDSNSSGENLATEKDLETFHNICNNINTEIKSKAALLENICNKMDTATAENTKVLKELYRNLEKNQVQCNKNITTIENIKEKMSLYGIFDVRPRTEYDNEFYKKIYNTTENTLIISGHSLNNTISKRKASDLRKAFKKAIMHVLKNNGTVKILLQKPRPDDQDAHQKRQWFNDFVKELVDSVIAEKWHNEENISEHLLIKEIDNLRYFIVQTDSATLIAHYKMKQSADNDKRNNEIYVFEVNPNGSYGSCYLADFNYVFDRESVFVEETMEQLKRLAAETGE